MKFYALILFSLLIISDLPFGISRTWRITTASPTTVEDIDIPEEATTGNVPVSYDFTETITKSIAQILKNFNSHISEWTSNKIWFNNGDIITTSLILEEDDYLVTFSNIFIEEQNVDIPIPNSQQISCEFSNNLKIQMPFRGTRLWLRGDILLQSTTNISSFQTDHFNVYFNELLFSMTTKSDLSFIQKLPNNFTEIDISYSNSNIDMSTNHYTESISAKAISSLMEEIKSYLKSVVEEELQTISRDRFSFYPLFTTCMQPKNEISRIDQNYFVTQEQNYYVGTDPNIIDLGNSITLQIDTTRIKGLQNLKSIDIIQNDYPATFSLRIDNLTGESGWKYNSDGIGPLGFTPIQFSIDHATIQGTLGDRDMSILNLEIAPVVIASDSSDAAAALLEKILEKSLKNTITSSITNSLMSMYSQI